MLHSLAVYNFSPPGWTTTPLATYVYSYDNASRVTSEKDAEGTASFTYDNANELTGVSGSRTESYGYDLNGNRNTTGYTRGAENEMTASPNYIYTYDNSGNMTGSTNSSTHTTMTYSYDYRNRLIGVTSGGSAIATYTYNALNQRIGVKDNGTQTWTVYDGKSPDAQPYADFNSSGNLSMHYVHGAGVINGAVVDELLARTTSDGTTAWYLPDKLGTVRDVVDRSGNELDHIVYDSFGKIVTETNASNGDRFKFAGMEYNSSTGQYYDRARAYNSAAGRFMNPDPIGFQGGDANLYRYVGNGPTDATDPTGLLPPIVISPNDFITAPNTLNYKTKPGIGEFVQIMNSPLLQLMMSETWRDYVNQLRKRHGKLSSEFGRWVVWNPETGQIAVTTIGVRVLDHFRVIFTEPNIPGWTPIGNFHTHFGPYTTGLSPSWPDMHPPIGQPLYPGATFNMYRFKVFMPTYDQNMPADVFGPFPRYDVPIGDFPNPPDPTGPSMT
jgi:RHS repeat-associated protein